jgi:putative flippase GtrA
MKLPDRVDLLTFGGLSLILFDQFVHELFANHVLTIVGVLIATVGRFLLNLEFFRRRKDAEG